MRLATFEVEGTQRLGAVIDGDVAATIVDLPAAAAALAAEGRGPSYPLPDTMMELLQGGDSAMDAVRDVLDALAATPPRQASQRFEYPLDAVKLRAPLPVPGKILCIGQNYRDHVLEQNGKMPERPIIFAKFANTVIGPDDEIIYPTTTKTLDYEAELVVVIGRGGKHISRETAYDHVAGYMAGQDVTARDIQKGDGQWVRGKTQDASAPMGPYLVTRDEVPDPQALDIKLWVNGEIRQDSNTVNLIFDVPTLIAFISEGITLAPGDVIYTGTPPGVGAFRTPPAFLQVGDEVTLELTGLGRLTNHVVADPLAHA